MRVLVTGASGFVGQWLTSELREAAHVVDAMAPDIDVTDAAAVNSAIRSSQPDAIAHLAAVAFAPDAAVDSARSFDIAVRGTINVLETVRGLARPPVMLVSGSAEVYGVPDPSDLPLAETAALQPRTPYALSKVAQESVALAYAARFRLTVIATRSFNHAGPGQRPVFVIPALAHRVRDLAAGRAPDIPVGNLQVRRDFSDVRDVVHAYRLLLEAGATDRIARGGTVVNVCTGHSVAIGAIVSELAKLAGIEPRIRVDPALVRSMDAPDIRGDHALLTSITGWQPRLPLSRTLSDVWNEVAASATDIP